MNKFTNEINYSDKNSQILKTFLQNKNLPLYSISELHHYFLYYLVAFSEATLWNPSSLVGRFTWHHLRSLFIIPFFFPFSFFISFSRFPPPFSWVFKWRVRPLPFLYNQLFGSPRIREETVEILYSNRHFFFYFLHQFHSLFIYFFQYRF